MTLTIGLTGGIASGKSTIANMLKKEKLPVIDADVISRQVVEPTEKAYEEILATFGSEILHEDNTINRKKLGELVFSNNTKREQLNNIVHPAVREKMLKKRDEYIEKKEQVIVLDIPLLFESKLTNLVDKILVVYVKEEIQLKRLMARDNSSKADATNRIKSQLSIDEKKRLADAVVDNGGTKEESKRQLMSILEEWKIDIE
ncbi:dephospho-CoA kinase [Aquibacillus saliphilus]|uniref:dephospho-CoA kinase n=1 Tax=Aquibacillus saliphilus TaxID=1909422 RepID=UPI001CEFBD43|nr:dephospho-CoA kinase [Aquibacillus saliphilus]